MSLKTHRALANVAVTDMARAREFYEGKLGLEPHSEPSDGGCTYECGDGTAIHVYPNPAGAGASGATQVGWLTADLGAAVDELAGNGVEFEQYDTDTIKTDERGIATIGDASAAWFKDPDGNILGVLDSLQ
ncbi:MAG: VOC family protein [Solirubrobacterales bacterium]